MARPRIAVVTGAAGFLGRAFRAALRARGWDVRGVDVRPGPDVTVGDVSRAGAWSGVLDGASLVVHAAAVVTEGGDPATFWRVNVDGTRTVLDEAARAGVGRVLHLSATVVHGRDFPDGVDETGAVRMTGNPYTDTKVAAEHQVLLAAAAGRVGTTVVRLGEVYGPHGGTWTVRPVELMRRGLFVLIDGGRGVLSPTYVDDAVDGGLAAALSDDGLGEVFHVTGGQGVPAVDYFGRYAAMLGVRLRSLPAAAAAAMSGPLGMVSRAVGWHPPLSPRTVEYVTHRGTYSIAKAAHVLDWTPRVSLDDGMVRTQEWLRDAGLVPEPAADAGTGDAEAR
ncbi:MAG TPA: NAD-dependent epimerase/dehydratase family protein [Egibacteraceae bacterium]|nr:NAD-dependent epimerase/dehydratase family protein [Egibacteraceae bacterium]